VLFLLDTAFTTPKKLLNPAVINRFRHSGVASDVLSMQKNLLQSLLAPVRMNRLFDAEVIAPNEAYTAVELVTDLQTGLWSELTAKQPKIEPLRRELQRAYLELLLAEFEPTSGAAGAPAPKGGSNVSELRSVARTALRDLAKRISGAIPQVTEAATLSHLEDAASQIDAALTHKKK